MASAAGSAPPPASSRSQRLDVRKSQITGPHGRGARDRQASPRRSVGRAGEHEPRSRPGTQQGARSRHPEGHVDVVQEDRHVGVGRPEICRRQRRATAVRPLQHRGAEPPAGRAAATASAISWRSQASSTSTTAARRPARGRPGRRALGGRNGRQHRRPSWRPGRARRGGTRAAMSPAFGMRGTAVRSHWERPPNRPPHVRARRSGSSTSGLCPQSGGYIPNSVEIRPTSAIFDHPDLARDGYRGASRNPTGVE